MGPIRGMVNLATMPERAELEAKGVEDPSHPRWGLNDPQFAETARDLADLGFCACIHCCQGVVDNAREAMQRSFGTKEE